MPSALDGGVSMVDSQTLLDYLRKNGCYLENGHFKLVSGKHSDSYIQVRIGMMDNETRQVFGDALSRMLSNWKPTALAAYTVGGILLASEAARRLRVPALIGTSRIPGRTVTWINAEDLDSEALGRVVIVDDILTTGGTLRPGIRSLKEIGANVVGAAIAVDRSEGEGEISLDGKEYDILGLIRLALSRWDPSNCPICPEPYVNLHNPEEDFLSVVLSMPSNMADTIISGYKDVYKLQRDEEQIGLIEQWEPWLPALLAGLPRVRVGEDSALAQFIHRFIHLGETDFARKRVLTELVGHLLLISHVRVEARTLGCSIMIGSERKLLNILQANVPVKVPSGITTSNLERLIPYYDALQEMEAVFLFDKDGQLFGIKRLTRSTESSETRGIQLLRQITDEGDALGLVVRRKRKALSVYREGRLEAVAELSEKTGTWEFMTPRPIVEDIDSLIPGIARTLETVLEISREMVDRGYGGLFVIGDIPHSLQYKPPKIEVEEQPLAYLGTGAAAEMAKLDGAVFVSSKGEIKKASVIILNAADRESISSYVSAPPPPKTGGSRKETAYQTSKECPNTAVVCVSQNGTIEIFVSGESWPVSEAITGVSES